MKQIATILLLIFSLASITSVDSGSISAPKPRKEHAPLTSTYEDKGRMDIADITDILHDSRLELPQSVRLSPSLTTQRNKKMSTSKEVTEKVIA